MKSIHEALRQKELELQQVLNDAVRQKEIQLRELQRVLLNAHQLVNRLLEADGETPLGAVELLQELASPAQGKQIVPGISAAGSEPAKTMAASVANTSSVIGFGASSVSETARKELP